MRIQQILSQYRRDFTARYECEHCGATKEGSGYDDAYFHETVIPGMTCEECGKKADATYHPMPTRYPEGYQV